MALSASAKSPLSGLRGKHSATCRRKALPNVISADCALVRREILRLAATNQLKILFGLTLALLPPRRTSLPKRVPESHPRRSLCFVGRLGHVRNHQHRWLISIVIAHANHPQHSLCPNGIVSPARQLGTAVVSVGGSAGVPSSSLNRNPAIQNEPSRCPGLAATA